MNNRMPTPLSCSAPTRAGVAGSQIVAGRSDIAAAIAKHAPKNKLALCSTGICQYNQATEALPCKIDFEHGSSMHALTYYSKYVARLDAKPS